jgi:hypothetical protein
MKTCKICKYYEEGKWGDFYCKLHKTHFYTSTPCVRFEPRDENI